MMLWNQCRIRRIAFGLAVVFIVLIVRLGWIQFVLAHRPVPTFNRTLREMAVLQREQGVMLDTGRGRFTDKDGRPLTGKLQWSIVLFPRSATAQSKQYAREVKQLAKLLHTSAAKLEQEWSAVRSPRFWTDGTDEARPLTEAQVQQIRELNVAQAKAVPLMNRYSDSLSGMQWLGYLAQLPAYSTQSLHQKCRHDEVRQPLSVSSGAGGLEKTLEPLLRGLGPTILSQMVDGHRQAIPEYGPHLISPRNPHYPLIVQTTLDLPLQQRLEALAEKSGMREGAIVVLDAANADVRAMVSLPFYNPKDVHPKGGQWENRAVKGAVPGSIFKIVTAAAALEASVVSKGEKFHCSGEYGKYGLSCWERRGHGSLTLAQGFAKSCNIVFAHMAHRLTTHQLEQTALALGLGRKVGWEAAHVAGLPRLRPLDHEDAGRIWARSTPREDEGARTQTAIGQRDTLVSPLQAANLVVTLLHDGQARAPRLIERINYADGGLLEQLAEHKLSSRYGAVSPATARTLRRWMRSVVTSGTGYALQAARWRVAGKSGTAEVNAGNQPRHNQWFIGYGPLERPRYAVAVLVQNVAAGAHHQATAIFRQVMDELALQRSSGSNAAAR